MRAFKSDKYTALLPNEGQLMKMHWWRTGRMSLSQVAIVTNAALAPGTVDRPPHRENWAKSLSDKRHFKKTRIVHGTNFTN